ncbi:predicted transcriptional regulator [Hahella chejuensis KCTC 2396]|uniref:Predicted transcriptional regulator n=1 Tax=Hahella chejuensis (strain KCTC 2396) TaxID=349521 RepID=Q2SF66_HAHCH|nr:helix-turn-helix transcriptional regulator [Hahella chejuensis]ABC30708.1 predicted transcriptional regulator [Hahella chejuensis KCTC 2396]
MTEDFCSNLKLLCSHYKSTAEVCRRMEIHRAQFNKYLNGTSQPSRFVLRKICDFFGVEPHELDLPHDRFMQVAQSRANSDRDARAPDKPYAEKLERLQQQSEGRLDKYLGYYYEYHFSMTFPDQIIRSLLQIDMSGNDYYFRRLERMRPPNKEEKYKSRYEGTAMFLSERIFLVGYETLTHNEIAQTILYPTYKSRVSYLSGLKLGVSASDRREPVCVKVVLEYLGRSIRNREALQKCGLFNPATDAVARHIKEKISDATGYRGASLLATPL